MLLSGMGGGVAKGAGSGALAGTSMFGPIGGLAGAGLGAALGGVTNYMQGQKEEEEARKAARRELQNRFLAGGDMAQPQTPVKQGPSLAESVGKPLLGVGIESLGQIGKTPKEDDPEFFERAAKGYLGATR